MKKLDLRNQLYILLLYFLFTTPLFSLSVIKMSFSDIVKKSSGIYYAKYAESEVDDTGEIHKFIISLVVKGEKKVHFRLKEQNILPFRFLDSIKKGDEAIVFISKENKLGYSIITGFNQGFFKIIKENDKSYVMLDNSKLDVDEFIKKIREL